MRVLCWVNSAWARLAWAKDTLARWAAISSLMGPALASASSAWASSLSP